MEIEKNYRINSLFEFYQPLLTAKQNNYMQLYYGDDYSLGEIADTFSVSRQAVYDNIRRTEKILENYEAKLHLYAEFVARNQLADDIQDYVNAHYANDKTLMTLVAKLESAEEE
ncbi:putative DNA-binding protein [Secundilactobacillus kimchicus]|uniref:putative DNA-binding protein n=1 Tax=Secundilactobacillus kimchicus TaxID=528209 RepID=UPI001C02358A|nr:putative DNA-binding protein [Secundilactobacillus kimchicus]MBT9672845.1 putative DNA-binding protein [Secundilactobacillus kimchicus]